MSALRPEPAASTTEPAPEPTIGRDRLAWLLLAAVVLLGTLARILAHHGVPYAAADEATYAARGCQLAQQGLGAFPGFVRDYLADPQLQLYPSPARWGFYLLAGLASSVFGCGPAAIAWLATLSGVVLLVLVALMVRRWFGPWHAVVATALVAASPLQLHLGRRGLSDELVCVLALAAIWSVFAYAERRTARRLVLALAVLSLGFAAKEIFFMLYPLLLLRLAVDWFRGRRDPRDLLVPVVPPLVSYLGFTALAHDPAAYGQVLRHAIGSAGSGYSAAYQTGAPQRLLIDLLALSPIVFLLAVASLGLLLDRPSTPARWIAAAIPLVLAPYAIAQVEGVRFVAVADVLLCILAAWGVLTALRTRHGGWSAGLVAVIVAVDAWLFWAVSVRGEVYDPVTATLLRSLHMIP